MQIALDSNARDRPTPRPWRPSPAIRASIGLHAIGAAAVALQPGVWPWVAGAVAANHVLLGATGFVPRSNLLGPNLRSLPAAAIARREVALTFDDGPDPDITPRVLDELDRLNAKATFFVIGERARAHPQLVSEIVRRGHAVENHTDTHSVHFAWYGPKRLYRELASAQQAISDACGVAPVLFRAPMGFRTPFLEPVLSRLGLHLSSWTRRGFDTVERDPGLVVRRLVTNLRAGDILLLHDGIAVLNNARADTVQYVPALMRHINELGLRPVTLRAACNAGVL